MNNAATSGRETLANKRVRRTIRPARSTVSPAAAHRTTAGVRRMNADAETAVTPCFRSRPATFSSRAGSFGEWIRLTPQLGRPPSVADRLTTARSTAAAPSPAAPKNPSISAWASAVTRRVVAIPLAISPAT